MDAVLAFGFGYQEMIIVLFIALLLFGKKLPEVARNMGKGLTEFKKGMRGIEDEVHGAASYDPGPTAERPLADDELDPISIDDQPALPTRQTWHEEPQVRSGTSRQIEHLHRFTNPNHAGNRPCHASRTGGGVCALPQPQPARKRVTH